MPGGFFIFDQLSGFTYNTVGPFANFPIINTSPKSTLLKVEEAFSGVNYLEALTKTNKDGLVDNLSNLSNYKNSGGSLQSSDADSIFNKFSIFKYSKFINGATYQPQAHFIGYGLGAKNDPNNDDTDSINQLSIYNNITSAKNEVARQKRINDLVTDDELAAITANAIAKNQLITQSANEYAIKNTSSIANPTAKNIIKWASTQSMHSTTGFQPYAMTDFMFCKNYGKIPNNRLITLRRYPFPIDDALRIPGRKNPIPIAQAVTWFGGDTKNTLSKIGVMNWNMKWKKLSVKEQIIEGNEVTVTDLANVFKKIPKLEKLGDTLLSVYVGLNGNDSQLQQLSGIEKRMQDYVKLLYTDTGPYWNRVYGPVNVIHESTRRERGMQDGWDTPFTINFHYSFRSFNGLSPKIVALDLISNFLNLTYNDAEFLGQLSRYFPRLGVKFDQTMTELIGEVLTKWGTSFNNDFASIADQLNPILNAMQTSAVKAYDDLIQTDESGNNFFKAAKKGTANTTQALTASLLSDVIPKWISARSALSDRPIGEWHLVVGNPMNPIMTMGDLIVNQCTLEFDEEMGPDDFPTGCTFSVKLKQGKPRDKVAIERIFNLGQAKLMYNKLRNPSSADDTFGETNNKKWKELVDGSVNGENAISDEEKEYMTQAIGTGSFDQYRNRIRKSYGYTATPDTNASNQNGSSSSELGMMDDSLLWLYFDRGEEKT